MIRRMKITRSGQAPIPGRPLLLSVAGALLVAGCLGAGGDVGSTGSSGAASTDPSSDSNGAPTCDPETFVATCVEGRVVECSEDGFVEIGGCGSRSRCEVGADGPGCVWRVGEPCEDEYERCIDPGGILACKAGFWRFEGCPPGGACSHDECFGPEDTPCDWPEDDPYCEGATVVSCWDHGFEVAAPCEPGDVCRTGVYGGTCVSSAAVSCDPEGFRSMCQGARSVVSCGVDGWTKERECSDGDLCFEGLGGAGCRDKDSVACDSQTYSATCADGLARWCGFDGVELETQCDADTQCLVDETCVLFDCQEVALCAPLDAEPCEEPVDSFCMGDLLSVCFAGHILPGFECECTEDEDGATCAA